MATEPLVGWVTEATDLGPPSLSVSLARTLIALAPESSDTIFVSLTAVGGASTGVTV